MTPAFSANHIAGETWVIGGISLVCYVDGGVLALRDGGFTRYQAGAKKAMDLTSSADFERVVREEMRLPELPITAALRALNELGAFSMPS